MHSESYRKIQVSFSFSTCCWRWVKIFFNYNYTYKNILQAFYGIAAFISYFLFHMLLKVSQINKKKKAITPTRIFYQHSTAMLLLSPISKQTLIGHYTFISYIQTDPNRTVHNYFTPINTPCNDQKVSEWAQSLGRCGCSLFLLTETNIALSHC